ncbi:MAG: hypothetical protein JRN17_05200 [Nitrososphaerota archaeon]|nr:hypothetical protein [Nitrososphaerota archaeon]MDG7012963.1 hypothetical protein [Nitrososphaerota archaeon]
MSAVVELDEKGRVLIPAEIRHKLTSRRLKVSMRGDVVELEPLPGLKELKGKYRHRIRSDWEALEEMSEDLVWKR